MAVISPNYSPGRFTGQRVYSGTARGNLLSATIDTKPYRGTTIGDPNFGRPIGDTAKALNQGNERLGNKTVDTALALLQARLDPSRSPINAANKAAKRGVRAALEFGDMVEVDPYGRGYQVGRATEFFRYDAGYVTVTERGGGFIGDLYGKILAFDGRPTTGTKEATAKTSVAKSVAKRDKALLKRQQKIAAERDRPGASARAKAAANAEINKLNKRRASIRSEFSEVKNLKKSGSFRQGRPLPPSEYAGKISRLAAGFKPQPKGTKGGYTWQIRQERAPKNFMQDAADLVWVEAQAEYRNAFRRFKITGFTKGSLARGPVVSANPVSSPFYN